MQGTPARVYKVTREGAGEPTPAAADRHLAGSAVAATWNAFTNAAGRFHVGHWAAEPGVRAVDYTEDEFCLVLEGRVRLVAADGAVEFGPGDAFVIAAGFRGRWETLEPLVKLYAIAEA